MSYEIERESGPVVRRHVDKDGRAGLVRRQTGPESYGIEQESGPVVRRHVDEDGRAGLVRRQTGPVSYEIEQESGPVVRRHMDHIKKWIGPDSNRVRELVRTNTHKRNQSRDTDPHEGSLVSLSPTTEMSNGTRDTQTESLLRESMRCSLKKKITKLFKIFVTETIIIF